jgi:uncharacterized protein
MSAWTLLLELPIYEAFMQEQQLIELQAAAFRRLLAHLQQHSEIQNIELMIHADFCRNCLAKWLVEESALKGLPIDDEQARALVYGMPYAEWKQSYQQPATAEQLAAYEARQKQKQEH